MDSYSNPTLSLAAAKPARLLGQRVGHPAYRKVEKERGRKGGPPAHYLDIHIAITIAIPNTQLLIDEIQSSGVR